MRCLVVGTSWTRGKVMGATSARCRKREKSLGKRKSLKGTKGSSHTVNYTSRGAKGGPFGNLLGRERGKKGYLGKEERVLRETIEYTKGGIRRLWSLWHGILGKKTMRGRRQDCGDMVKTLQ